MDNPQLEARDIVERLRTEVNMRNSTVTPLRLEAADTLLAQRAQIAELRAALDTAEQTLDQILDDMRDGGQCVCLAVKNEAIETLAVVRAALAENG